MGAVNWQADGLSGNVGELSVFNGGSGWLWVPEYGANTPWIYYVPGGDDKNRKGQERPNNTTPLVGRPGTKFAGIHWKDGVWMDDGAGSPAVKPGPSGALVLASDLGANSSLVAGSGGIFGNSSLKDWIPFLIRMLGDVTSLPTPPLPSATATAVQDDFSNLFTYTEALAKRGQSAMLMDAIARGIDVALKSGKTLKTPPADIKRWGSTALAGLAALKALPTKPVAVADTATNIKNYVAYQASLASYAQTADLADTVGTLVDDLTM